MTQPKIIRVRIKNYKSIGQADVALAPLTVIVGPNGSGKSNFRDALNLVSDALQSTLEFAIRQRGGIAEVRRRSTGHPTHFAVQLSLLLASGVHATYAFEIGATKDGGFSVARERALVETSDVSAPAEFETVKGSWVTSSSHIDLRPRVTSDRLLLATMSAHPSFRELFDTLERMRFYSIDPNAFRQPQPHDAGEVLLPTGKNIGAVIRRLKQDDTGAFERIQDYMRNIVPGLDRVEHESLGPAETIVFAQKVPGAARAWSFYAASVSDGTLRSLGVLTALFQTHPRLGAPTFVGIEEPESTIHPGAASVVMEALIEASKRHQVLLTTHSPDMLDHEGLNIDSVRIVENRDGETIIGAADKASRDAVYDRLFTPGELLRQKHLAPAAAAFAPKKQLDLFKFPAS